MYDVKSAHATEFIDHEEVLNTVKNLHAQGTTIIYITHFMEEAFTADKILLMDGGKIITAGTDEK